MRSASSRAGREHDHGQLGALADPAADGEAVGAGQHQVEDDQVRTLVLDERDRRVAVPGLERAVALAAQVLDDDLADDRLVIDDKHRRHPGIVRDAGRRRVTEP